MMTMQPIATDPKHDSGLVESLYSHHSEELASYLRNRGCSPWDSEEIVQETFLRIVRFSERLDRGRIIRGLIFRTAKNVLIDRKRSECRQVTHRARSLHEHDFGATEAESVETADETEAVLEIIAGQTEESQTIMRLHYFAGMSYREVSEYTGVSVTTCKERVARVLAIIRERMVT